MPSSGLYKYYMHVVHRYTGKTLIHIKIKIKNFKWKNIRFDRKEENYYCSKIN